MVRYRFSVYRDVVRDGSPTGDAASRTARVRSLRDGRERPDGEYVLYWMQMYMRGSENAALDEAVRQANRLGLPLVIYQGLNSDYPEATARTHTFILECARDVATELAERGLTYRFHLRRSSADDLAVAAILGSGAARVVVDDFPAFILPRVTRGFLKRTAASNVPVDAVDANGLVALDRLPGRQYAAYTLRPRLHALVPEFVVPHPSPELEVRARPRLPVDGEAFVPLEGADDERIAALVAECSIDHSVGRSPRYRGGRVEARARLESFIANRLDRYGDDRNDPSIEATSGLSPYMHFGCLSTVEVVRDVLLADARDEPVDDFLEELVVRRELAFNFCRFTPVAEHTSLDALPDWARKTMSEHAEDERATIYSPDHLERGTTHDELWNAAQHELVATGSFHGYLRMLWGKSVIRWTRSYAEAQDFMLRMHYRYALDGRDPNTYANILWCFGLHDRAFGERAVLGKLRTLKSASTRRKFDVDAYIERIERPRLEGF